MQSIVKQPSPNFNVRQHAISMLVLHYTGMQNGEAALERLCDEQAGVSCHYVVEEDGRIFQLVDETHRAWHAGKGGWRERDDINSRAIGIEIVNGGHDWPLDKGKLPPFPDIQIAAVITLAKDIVERHVIEPSNIVGHSDIAPSRKRDPGEHFPWARLASCGISKFPRSDSAIATPLIPLNSALAAIGYPLEDHTSGSASLEACITAFQRRFMPSHLTGETDSETVAHANRVCAAFGIASQNE